MRFITTFITLLYAVTWAERIDCGDGHCANSVIDASDAKTLFLSCPALSSCRNMTVLCPLGNATLCEISCTDSFSCDRMTIHSPSTATALHCVSPNVTKTNICTNNITLHLSLDQLIEHATNTLINCTGTNVTVCDSITVTTDIDTPRRSLHFHCEGDGVQCDAVNITTPSMENIQIVVNGTEARLNGSRFVTNHNIAIKMYGRRSLLSMSTFMGPSMVDGSTVTATITNDSVCASNTFIFNDLTAFSMINPVITSSAQLIRSNITITNPMGRVQSVMIKDISGDGSSNISAEQASTFTLHCMNNDSSCGSFGILDVMSVEDIRILVDNGVLFNNTINAQYAVGVNMTVLGGGVLNGMTLNVQSAEQIYVNIYGHTRGKNVINGVTALGFDIFCNNPKSCSDDLELVISPGKTNMYCVGTGCDRMTLNVTESADEVAVDLTYCPCDEYRHTLCLSEWDIVCNEGTHFAAIKNGQCTGECCGRIIDELHEAYSNPYECPLSNATTYICQAGEECVVDCQNTTQFDEKSAFVCSGGMVDASHALWLNVRCGNAEDAGCSKLNVACPNTNLFGSNCNVSCTEKGACADVMVNTLRNGNVYLGCLADGSCANITVDNTVSNASFINAITVECSDGLCTDINVIGDGAHVLFECMNCTFDRTNISNKNGATTITATGQDCALSDAIIWSDSLTVSGEKYSFTANTITYNTTHNTSASFTDFKNNTYALSLNIGANRQDTAGILFKAMNDTLLFETSDSISVVIDPSTRYSVRVMNPLANFSVYNNAARFDAKQIDVMNYKCGGVCRNNRIMVSNAKKLIITATAEDTVMDGRDTEVIAVNLMTLDIANIGGRISNFHFNVEYLSSVHVSNLFGGVIHNISVHARDVIQVDSQGIIDQLHAFNEKGSTSITMQGNDSALSESIIWSDSLAVSGAKYSFTANKITYNTMQIVGNGEAVFGDNFFTDYKNKSYALSFNIGPNHQDTAGILFKASDKTLLFETSDSISVVIDPGALFSGYSVRVINPLANFVVYNNAGQLTNTTFNVEQIDAMSYMCGGVCRDNRIFANNTSNLTVLATGLHAVIDGMDTKIFAPNLKTLNIGNAGGTIGNFTNTANTVDVSNQFGGVMKNISLNARDVIQVASHGIIDQLYVGGSGGQSQVIVNVTGTLNNSVIDGTHAKTLSVICASEGAANFEGYCANVTLNLATSSSLLCRSLGCQNLTFRTTKDIDDMDITLTECPCDKAVRSSCIEGDNQWNIYCDASLNGVASVFKDNTCHGECCGSIIDDLKVKNCHYPGGGGKKKSTTGGIVGAVCGTILGVIMIAAAVYYFKKKKKAQREADSLLVNA